MNHEVERRVHEHCLSHNHQENFILLFFYLIKLKKSRNIAFIKHFRPDKILEMEHRFVIAGDKDRNWNKKNRLWMVTER